ncbi:hypothetical protein V1505DRAFT_318055 [Lipomyces doorenjongii]
MSKTTEIGCNQEIDLAIKAAPTDSDKEYARKEWKERKHTWAASARQHSAVLLHVDTTNSVENFHSVIKSHNSGKSLKKKYSITGLVAHLRVLGQRIKEDAKRANEEFRTKHLKEVEQMPELRLFPYPVQKLIMRELDSTREMTEEEPDYIDPNNVTCDCLFFRNYDILTREQWQDFAFMFEDSGYEIYEGRGREYLGDGIRQEIGAPDRRTLTFKELLERLRTRYYELDEDVSATYSGDSERRENTMNLWISSLQRSCAAYLTDDNLEYIINSSGRVAGSEEEVEEVFEDEDDV